LFVYECEKNKFDILDVSTGTLTTSLLPVRPFEDPVKHNCITREIEEFAADNDGISAYPHTSYLNHLYIHPRSLKYDGQKAFAKVNIVVQYYPVLYLLAFDEYIMSFLAVYIEIHCSVLFCVIVTCSLMSISCHL